MGAIAWALLVFVPLILWYIRSNDAKLVRLPKEALQYSPKRVSPESALQTAHNFHDAPISIAGSMPPRTGRRYIVVGGAGFLGGWIVRHLIERGEDPRKIRVLDIRPSTRPDLTTGPAAQVDFRQVDISDADAVNAAFAAPWPAGHGVAPLTVLHTAANIRFFERVPWLMDYSTRVNVRGTQNVINAARAAGASVLVYTSSGSISLLANRWLLRPWESQPAHVVQVLDDASPGPVRHEDFFSNYAASKCQAERVVRAADRSRSENEQGCVRTGCIRPGNGIYGWGGDTLCEALLFRKINFTWMRHILQNFVYVENCSLAHLCYEARLIAAEDVHLPDVGGQAFNVADAGPPITYGDMYTVLHTLSGGASVFPAISPTLMLLLATLVEAYYLLRFRLSLSPRGPLRSLGRVLPKMSGDILGLQPSSFNLTLVHLVFDWSRAARDDGLGYRPPWTTVQGLCRMMEMHEAGGRRPQQRSVTLGLRDHDVEVEVSVATTSEKMAPVAAAAGS